MILAGQRHVLLLIQRNLYSANNLRQTHPILIPLFHDSPQAIDEKEFASNPGPNLALSS